MPSQQPVLYSFRRCPYAMRARFALQITQTRCELREVVLKDKPQAMLDASPKGTVPVLINIDGQVIDESIDVMLWALQQSDPENWLTPEHGTLTEMLSLIAEFDTNFKPNLDRYKYPNRFDNVNPAQARDEAAEYLGESTQALANSPYLFGSSPSLADMALIPFVRQFANTDPAWFNAEPWPGLQRWLSSVLDSALFAAIMQKYPKWVAPASGAVFPAI
jgi:glutathione S-transferase